MIEPLRTLASPAPIVLLEARPPQLTACGLLDLLAARDPATLDHSRAVARLAVAIATHLGLDHAHVQRLRVAALLHDIGKLALPDDVLRKPGPLTEHERELVRMHPVWGQRVAQAAGLTREARWILLHHERPDGGGYPHGLCGREIPMSSRILHVGDAFDAMVSDRPYRAAQPRRRALETIVAGAGHDFDPECAAALTAVAARIARPGFGLRVAPWASPRSAR